MTDFGSSGIGRTFMLPFRSLRATQITMRSFFTRLAIIGALLLGSLTTPAIAEMNEDHAIEMAAQDCSSCDHGHRHDDAPDSDEGHAPDHHHCSMTFAVMGNGCEFSGRLAAALLAASPQAQLTSRSTAPPIEPPAA